MRKILYWTVRRDYLTSFVPMRVTRLNGSRVYGSVNGIGMHCMLADTFGRFEEEHDARAACLAVRGVYQSFDQAEHDAKLALEKVRDQRNIAVQAALDKIKHESIIRADQESPVHATV